MRCRCGPERGRASERSSAGRRERSVLLLGGKRKPYYLVLNVSLQEIGV